ncbi:MAG TPA: glycosyltransferase [Bryobacteraceae bacterium]|nr:glycosyltransferase [Bryobacteraceae bacterium]
MRVAFFSPMPPSPSGIADYSQALVEPLKQLAEVEVFASAEREFRAGEFDIALYQIGNNQHHDFVYEAALKHPGVVVMHESNLHHLIADITIKRGDWDAYLAEVEYNGGAAALDYAQRVRALEVGPDYEGLAMTRRLLERSKALIVHSRFMLDQMRQAGFEGPVAQIPHGAWIPDADRMHYRERLGVDEATPLIGMFGYLKPYKRIAESLRAFRRLLRVEPRAKMILVGERHPDFPIDSLIRTLDLGQQVRVVGFTPIEDFTGYIAASDIVLNLRYPTVGETSGSLLRALGLGRAVIVSDVGAFGELPDEICLKAPVGAGEEDILFEYLNLLVSRPDLAQALGARARCYVQRECNWHSAARRYAEFLCAVKENREWREDVPTQAPETPAETTPVPPEYITVWAEGDAAHEYVRTHASRLARTLEITPPGGPEDRILEMGAYLQITPALHTKLGYGVVRGCYYGAAGGVDHRTVDSAEGERFECDIDLFDAEKDAFPYPDEYFSTVLCCELVEHLFHDPMHMMSEINRILKTGGHLVLTTPNITSLRALSAILQGYHPGFFTAYLRPSANGYTDARHNREYTPGEIHKLLENSGFSIARLETGPFREEPKPEHAWVQHLLERYRLDTGLHGDGIYAVGCKTGRVRERYPAWLYV